MGSTARTTRFGLVLGASLVALLPSCAGRGAMPPSQVTMWPIVAESTPANAKANDGSSYLYVANGGEIDIFRRNQPSKGSVDRIRKGVNDPAGIFIGSQGTLYVTTSWESGNDSVDAYKEGADKPFRVYTGAYCAFDVIATDDGTVYIADACGGKDTLGRVLVYPPGRSAPSRSFYPGGAPYCLALDAKENLYVGYNANKTYWGQVKRYRPGAKQGVNLLPDQTVFFLTGIAVDNHGALLVAARGVIDVFAQKGQPPSRVIRTGQTYPYMFVLDRPEKTLYVSDQCTCCPGRRPLTSSSGCGSLPHSVVALDYSSGKRLWVLTTAQGEPWKPTGVAVLPPAPF